MPDRHPVHQHLGREGGAVIACARVGAPAAQFQLALAQREMEGVVLAVTVAVDDGVVPLAAGHAQAAGPQVGTGLQRTAVVGAGGQIDVVCVARVGRTRREAGAVEPDGVAVAGLGAGVSHVFGIGQAQVLVADLAGDVGRGGVAAQGQRGAGNGEAVGKRECHGRSGFVVREGRGCRAVTRSYNMIMELIANNACKMNKIVYPHNVNGELGPGAPSRRPDTVA